jgi:hypothetical protein
MADFSRQRAHISELFMRRSTISRGGIAGFALRVLWIFAVAVIAVAAFLILMVVFAAALVLTPLIFLTIAVMRMLARERPQHGRDQVIEVDYERKD